MREKLCVNTHETGRFFFAELCFSSRILFLNGDFRHKLNSSSFCQKEEWT